MISSMLMLVTTRILMIIMHVECQLEISHWIVLGIFWFILLLLVGYIRDKYVDIPGSKP